jgi:hypothetical protein
LDQIIDRCDVDVSILLGLRLANKWAMPMGEKRELIIYSPPFSRLFLRIFTRVGCSPPAKPAWTHGRSMEIPLEPVTPEATAT